MSAIQIAAGAAVFLAGAGIAALVFWLRDRAPAGIRERVTGYRDVYEPLFADLWSDEMHKRLAALFVAERIAKSRSAARGLASVLISFIRRRLAGEAREQESYEDLRLALNILASGPVRAAQARSGQNIDLAGIDFRGAVLSGADFSGFRLAQCVFDRCQLTGARLLDADLSGASLAGADLTRADLRRADLSETDLTDAIFTQARVNAANFSNANIGGAILADAQGFVQEQLDQAFGDSGTAVPERMRFVAGRPQRTRRE
ncbi:MAG TPA: pentapeptide repeat-containing protein [Rhizomicrobium sp.]|jgi:hypothetical protein|nr:pentapeptide repeat-containing protein [Rhizomicrobium sp.]